MYNNLILKINNLLAAGDCSTEWTHDQLKNNPGQTIIEPLACGLELLILGLRNVVLALGLLFIVIGGIQLITSAGDPEKAAKAKQTITWAIIGIVLGLTLWLILTLLANITQIGGIGGDGVELKNPDSIFR